MLAAARPGRSRRMKTVAKSSMTDAVMTIWDSLAWKLFDSSSILLIIAVLVVATTAATKTASMLVRPARSATPKTERKLIVSSTVVSMKLSGPILRISSGSSSSPTVNRRSTIPSEARRLIAPRSWTSPRPKGPMMIPAISWPRTTGCLIFEKRMLKAKAANIASPRLRRRENSGVEAN